MPEELEVEKQVEEATAPQEEVETENKEATALNKGDGVVLDDIITDGDESVESNDNTEKVQEPEESKPRHKTGEERFHELTEQKYAAIARAKVAEERYQETLRRLEALEKLKTDINEPKKLTRPVIPTQESVDYDEAAYAAAMDKYQEDLDTYYDQKISERLQEANQSRLQIEAEERRQQAADAVQTAFFERQNKFMSQKTPGGSLVYPDYADVVFSDQFEIPTIVAQAIKRSDNGPELIYTIAKSPSLAAKLKSGTEMDALIELGKVATKIEMAKNTNKISNAPDPINPVNTNKATAQQDEEKMPIGDFMKRMENQWYGKPV